MEPLVSQEQVDQLALRLFARYCELGERARLNGGTLAALAGVSRARFGQLRRDDGGVGLLSFLRLSQLVPRLEEGLAEGWLPATGLRGRSQDVAYERIAGEPPPHPPQKKPS